MAGEKIVEKTLQETIKEMHLHFAKTGTYRAVDIVKVLGDPSIGITGNIQNYITKNT